MIAKVINAISMREHLKGFTAVELPLESVTPVLSEALRRFGPVKEYPLAGIQQTVDFLVPIKSFTTRFAAVDVGDWTYLVTDMKGETAYVDGYAISRATKCRAIGLMMLEHRREMQVFEAGAMVREIQSLVDGNRWYFRESGNVQPFEDSADMNRRKQERLSVDLLAKYFNRYTGRAVPNWSDFTDNRVVGLERSISESRVPIIHYETHIDI